jgi:putative restriction endonuclease
MSLQDLSSPEAVISAIEEYERLGRSRFLKKYGYAEAKRYLVQYKGKFYDSKAIAGVAHKYQFPDDGPLRAMDFSGGEATVQKRLEHLGFVVLVLPRKKEELSDRKFGDIPGVLTGTLFPTRRALADAGLHAPLQAGISGNGKEGAESIVLSGGYEDDLDFGDVIIYTGQGGRDPETGSQTADQELTRGNLGLVVSQRNGFPIRVIRGSEHRSMLSPESGYRYDGLFFVDSHWHEKGKAGFRVFRFRLVKEREDGSSIGSSAEQKKGGPPPRKTVTTLRVIRDSKAAQKVKSLHDFRCQVCGVRLETSSGPYSEAAHVRPLGAPHNGPDNSENILCLCPNHHVLFDYGTFSIGKDFGLLGLDGELRLHPAHKVDSDNIAYHREHIQSDLVSKKHS